MMLIMLFRWYIFATGGCWHACEHSIYQEKKENNKKKICKLVGLYVVLHSQTLYISITIGRTHFTIRNAGENAFQFFERIFAANETGQTVAVLPQS